MLSPRYVDTREQSRVLPLVRAGFTPQKLDSGDVAFPEAGGEIVGIEHKTVNLLVADIFSGHLVAQCRRVCEQYRFPILLIEGHWTREPKTGLLTGEGSRKVTWEQLWNELQSIQDLGMRLQLTTSPEHTISRILELAEYYAKGFHASVQRQVAGNIKVDVLSRIDGMGTKRSQALLEAMPTLKQVATASEEAIMAVDGFGPVQAKRIYDFWR